MAKVVIIGGGVAGLSAGIYSLLLGNRATVIERGATAGGNLTGWRREGYEIDNCIHWLTGTNPRSKTFCVWNEIFGISETEIVKNETLYTYEEGGVRLSLHRNLDKIREEMLKVSPEDKKETENFIAAIRAVSLVTDTGEGKGKTTDRLAAISRLIRYSSLSVGGLAGRFKNRVIRGFLRSFITEHFASLALIFVFAHFTSANADLPRGGSINMARRMCERFLSLGGELRLKSEAVKINADDGVASSLTLSDGEIIEADYIVITADPKTVFGRILAEKMPTNLSNRYHNPSLKRFSSFQAAFAVDSPTLPFQGDFCFPLPRRDRLKLGTEYLTLREFSHEKSFSPRGKNLIQIMLFLDEEASMRFIRLREQSPEGYKRKKRQLCDIIEGAICEKFPELKSKLRLIDSWSPATYKRYVGSEIGSYMSFLFKEGFIPTTLKIKSKTAKNIIWATQWQTPPGGLPIAAERGRRAAEKIARLEKASQGKRSLGKIKRADVKA